MRLGESPPQVDHETRPTRDEIRTVGNLLNRNSDIDQIGDESTRTILTLLPGVHGEQGYLLAGSCARYVEEVAFLSHEVRHRALV
jgi:hypothetical protein